MTEPRKWINVPVAARILDVSRATAWRYARDGRIRSKQTPTGVFKVAYPIEFQEKEADQEK